MRGSTTQQAESQKERKTTMPGVIQEALSYTNEAMLERYAWEKKLDISAARKLFEELKKFLVIVASLGERHSPPGQLDPIWHYFIIYDTEAYEKYCLTHFGRYLHHRVTESPLPRWGFIKEAVRLGIQLDMEIWLPAGGTHEGDSECG